MSIIGPLIAAGGSLAGGFLSGKSKKKAYKHNEKRVLKYTDEAAGIFGQLSPELLSIYRGIMPELQGLWQNQGARVNDIYRNQYQNAADASKQRYANSTQQLQSRGLLSSTNLEAFNRGNAAQDARDAMAIASAKAGTFNEMAIAEAASKLAGRQAAAGGIGNVGQTLASFPMAKAAFYGSGQMQPSWDMDANAIGALGGSLASLFENIGKNKGGPMGPDN